MRFITHIVIHCTAGYGSVESIQRYWRNVKKWKSPGYHFIVANDDKGTVHQLAPLNSVVNGVLGVNSNTIHISYIGGVDPLDYTKAIDTRTIEQKCGIEHCIKDCFEILHKTQSVQGIQVWGHRDFSPDKNGNGVIDTWERIKDCPSFDAISEYKSFLKSLKQQYE